MFNMYFLTKDMDTWYWEPQIHLFLPVTEYLAQYKTTIAGYLLNYDHQLQLLI